MKIISKISTLLKLLRSGAWSTIHLRANTMIAGWRLKMHGRKAFINRDLGFPSVCHPDWPESRQQFLGSVYDQFEFTLIREWLTQGDWFLDVGTNKGLFSFAALSVTGRSGGVLAIDADEFACRKFSCASELLRTSNARSLHAAVTDSVGSVTFYVSELHTGSEMQSIHPTEGALRDGMKPVTVPTIDLRTVAMNEFNGIEPAMIKMDIEGAEMGALKGAPGHWLEATGPMWIIEVNPGCLTSFGSSALELCEMFPRNSFDRWLFPKHPKTSGTLPTLRQLTDAEHFEDAVYYNLFAVPRGPLWQQRRQKMRILLPGI